jgi:hypothetical protein
MLVKNSIFQKIQDIIQREAGGLGVFFGYKTNGENSTYLQEKTSMNSIYNEIIHVFTK